MAALNWIFFKEALYLFADIWQYYLNSKLVYLGMLLIFDNGWQCSTISNICGVVQLEDRRYHSTELVTLLIRLEIDWACVGYLVNRLSAPNIRPWTFQLKNVVLEELLAFLQDVMKTLIKSMTSRCKM